MTVKLVKTEKTVSVEAPYNSIFVGQARRLGGRWNDSAWVFDIRELPEVQDLCMQAYGSDGERVDQVDVEVAVNDDQFYQLRGPLEIYGRQVARAFGRDSGAKIADGILVKSGDFVSDGSMKNWATSATEGTIFVMRDVSRQAVEDFSHESITVKIIASNKSGFEESQDREALIKELAELEARAAEIKELLGLSDEPVANRYEELQNPTSVEHDDLKN